MGSTATGPAHFEQLLAAATRRICNIDRLHRSQFVRNYDSPTTLARQWLVAG